MEFGKRNSYTSLKTYFMNSIQPFNLVIASYMQLLLETTLHKGKGSVGAL